MAALPVYSRRLQPPISRNTATGAIASPGSQPRTTPTGSRTPMLRCARTLGSTSATPSAIAIRWLQARCAVRIAR